MCRAEWSTSGTSDRLRRRAIAWVTGSHAACKDLCASIVFESGETVTSIPRYSYVSKGEIELVRGEVVIYARVLPGCSLFAALRPLSALKSGVQVGRARRDLSFLGCACSPEKARNV
jgi:hypothetical protein